MHRAGTRSARRPNHRTSPTSNEETPRRRSEHQPRWTGTPQRAALMVAGLRAAPRGLASRSASHLAQDRPPGAGPRIYLSRLDDADAGRRRCGDGGEAPAVQPPGVDPAGCPGRWHATGHDPDIGPRLLPRRPTPARDLVKGDLLDLCPGEELGRELAHGHL